MTKLDNLVYTDLVASGWSIEDASMTIADHIKASSMGYPVESILTPYYRKAVRYLLVPHPLTY